LVLKQSRCENPWRQFIAWGRQSDHHPRVVGAFVSACPAPACWSSLAVSLLRSLKFEIDPLLPALSTDPRLISYGSQISNPQTLRPTDSSLFEFKKYYCKSICVCIYIYIHPYLYIWYIWSKKKTSKMSTQCTAGSQLASQGEPLQRASKDPQWHHLRLPQCRGAQTAPFLLVEFVGQKIMEKTITTQFFGTIRIWKIMISNWILGFSHEHIWEADEKGNWM
jgi:hypothetical protein